MSSTSPSSWVVPAPASLLRSVGSGLLAVSSPPLGVDVVNWELLNHVGGFSEGRALIVGGMSTQAVWPEGTVWGLWKERCDSPLKQRIGFNSRKIGRQIALTWKDLCLLSHYVVSHVSLKVRGTREFQNRTQKAKQTLLILLTRQIETGSPVNLKIWLCSITSGKFPVLDVPANGCNRKRSLTLTQHFIVLLGWKPFLFYKIGKHA